MWPRGRDHAAPVAARGAAADGAVQGQIPTLDQRVGPGRAGPGRDGYSAPVGPGRAPGIAAAAFEVPESGLVGTGAPAAGAAKRLACIGMECGRPGWAPQLCLWPESASTCYAARPLSLVDSAGWRSWRLKGAPYVAQPEGWRLWDTFLISGTYMVPFYLLGDFRLL